MKKSLLLSKLLALVMLVTFTGLNAQVNVTADHSVWVEFPLMKIYGVNIPDNISYSTLETHAPLLQDLDVRYARVKNNWGRESAGQLFETPQVTVSGEDVSIDFTRVDQVVDLLKQNHAQVMFMNGYTPAGIDPDWNDLPDTTDGGLWYKLNREFAEHWVDQDLPGICYEIWNGTDSSTYFTSDPKGYQVLVREAINGIKDAGSIAKIGGGAFFTGEANEFKNLLAQTGSMMLGNDLRVCNFMRFWTAQTTGLDNLKDLIERGDDTYGSFRKWIDWFDFMHWECYITGYAPFELDGADAVNHRAASEFFETTRYMIMFSDVSRVYLDQFIEDTEGRKGLVSADGSKTALYNALKLYNQMPYDRKELTIGDADVHGLTSSDDKNASIVLWNMGDAAKDVNVSLSNLPFAGGNVHLYRIDESNDGSTATALDDLPGNSLSWSGSIPRDGVVIILISSGEPSLTDSNFGTFVQDHHYWWFRVSQPWMWHTFDPKTMTAFIGDSASVPGNDNKVNWGVSSFGAYVENMPSRFKVKVKSQGHMSWMDLNTQLVLRINLKDTLEGDEIYAKSMVFYDDDNFVFDPSHESNFCYQICAREDEQIKVDFTSPDGFEVDLSQYASPFWSGDGIIILGLQNPGTGKYYDENPAEAGNGLMLKFQLEEIAVGTEKPGELKGYDDMAVYPVPAGDLLNIRLSEAVTGYVNLTILDLNGRTVMDQRYPNNPGTLTVNTSELKQGIYLISLEHTNGILTRRVIIAH